MKDVTAALIKSISGDTSNTLAVVLGLVIAVALLGSGDSAFAGWAFAAELAIAAPWLAARYRQGKGREARLR